MTKEEIKVFLEAFAAKRDRTIVIVDYGNVEKWKNGLGWDVGIKELARLVKHFSLGAKWLRRFYYGSDFGPSEASQELRGWSRGILQMARYDFEIVTKRVKYMHDSSNTFGYQKKCDMDVEMAIDLVKERAGYDTIILFSGDGDLMYAVRYLAEKYGKSCYTFGARGHIGREVMDAKSAGRVQGIFFADDFEYRLRKNRFRP